MEIISPIYTIFNIWVFINKLTFIEYLQSAMYIAYIPHLIPHTDEGGIIMPISSVRKLGVKDGKPFTTHLQYRATKRQIWGFNPGLLSPEPMLFLIYNTVSTGA